MIEPKYEYKAHVHRVVDGDTLDLFVDVGFRIGVTARVRLSDWDAPEVSTQEGKALRDWMREWMPGQQVMIRTQKDPRDKYGRWIADVEVSPGRSLSEKCKEWLAEWRQLSSN